MRPPILKTARYHIKPYLPKDENRFVEMAIDDVSTRFMGGATGNEAEERELFHKILELYGKESGERWFWVWGIYKGNLLCGHLEMKETEHTLDNELEIVYMVHPNERKKGVMTEVLHFLKQNQQNWKKRIIATVNHDNLNSIALLEKWGIEKREILVDDDDGKEYLKLTLGYEFV